MGSFFFDIAAFFVHLSRLSFHARSGAYIVSHRRNEYLYYTRARSIMNLE